VEKGEPEKGNEVNITSSKSQADDLQERDPARVDDGQVLGPSRADLLQPARPADQWEAATEEVAPAGQAVSAAAATTSRPAERPLQVPRQREELKKDLLEAIKRKISKTKPGGGEERLEPEHHQVRVCVFVMCNSSKKFLEHTPNRRCRRPKYHCTDLCPTLYVLFKFLNNCILITY
jgi:hypothetical protein